MGNYFGRLPSELLEFENDSLALAVDREAAFALTEYFNKRDAKRFEIYFKTLSSMFTGKKPEYETDANDDDEM